MTHQEFLNYLEEMKADFGDKAFPPRVATFIWRIVQDIEIQDLRRAIEAMMIQERNFRSPSPALIRQYCREPIEKAAKARRTKKLEKLNSGKPCLSCNNYGVIFAWAKENPSLEYSFACTRCPAHTVTGQKYPLWEETMKERYEVIPYGVQEQVASLKLQQKLRIEKLMRTMERIGPKARLSRLREQQVNDPLLEKLNKELLEKNKFSMDTVASLLNQAVVDMAPGGDDEIPF